MSTTLNEIYEIIPSENKEYVMGVDFGGYDGNSFAMCLMRRVNDNIIVQYSVTTRDKENFKKDVEKVAKKYNIPPSDILTEKD